MTALVIPQFKRATREQNENMIRTIQLTKLAVMLVAVLLVDVTGHAANPSGKAAVGMPAKRVATRPSRVAVRRTPEAVRSHKARRHNNLTHRRTRKQAKR